MNQYMQNVGNMGQVYVNDYASDTSLQKAFMGGTQINSLENYMCYRDAKTTATLYAQPTKKENKMALAKNKRGLFQVILIDPKEKKILLNTIVISDSIEDVLLEVNAGEVIKTANLQVSDVDKIVNIIGQIRKTRKSKTGEVEIVNEADDSKE